MHVPELDADGIVRTRRAQGCATTAGIALGLALFRRRGRGSPGRWGPTAKVQGIDVDVRLVGRKVDAPDGLAGINPANAGLAFERGAPSAHPVNVEFCFSRASLDFDAFSG